jgi:isochorismate hydrolase
MAYLEKIKDYNIRRASPVSQRTALLVIDLQHYFNAMCKPIVENVLSLIDACRHAHIPVVYTRHGHRDPQKDGGMLGKWWGDLILYGSRPWELNDELNPSSAELLLDKNRYSAFHNSDLNGWLRQRSIEDVIISGVMTNCCCETTAREAFVRDYRVFFVADATATINEELHLASLKNLAYGFCYVVETEELIRHLMC